MDLGYLTILVTGGGGIGVGGGICEVLANYGATLLINELELAKAQAAADKYPKAYAFGADISDDKALNRMFQEISDTIGPFNGLVNNAGIGLSRKAHEATPREFDKLYSVDIRAVWNVSRLFTKQLLASGQKGSIVNISSVHAKATQPGYAIYSSAKGAVEGLTRGMAFELGTHNIRVNAIGPGLVHAAQNRELISRWTDDPDGWLSDFVNYQQAIPAPILPTHVGNTAAFLLSDMSASITGQTIYVDAGTTIMLHNRDFIEGRK